MPLVYSWTATCEWTAAIAIHVKRVRELQVLFVLLASVSVSVSGHPRCYAAGGSCSGIMSSLTYVVGVKRREFSVCAAVMCTACGILLSQVRIGLGCRVDARISCDSCHHAGALYSGGLSIPFSQCCSFTDQEATV